jgi:hypothetical protein
MSRSLSGVSRSATLVLLPFILLSFLIASSALADTFVLATGYSGGTALAQGAIDPNWTITGLAGYSSTYVLGPNVGTNWGYGAWWNNSGPVNAQWIGASSWNIGSNTTAAVLPTAAYSFQTTFNLSSFTLSTVVISGQWAIDDAGTLLVNGHQVASQTYDASGSPTLFTVPTADLVAGQNTMTINMFQNDAVNDGTILYATVTGSPAPVPAPAALLLFGPGLAALALVRRRLKN